MKYILLLLMALCILINMTICEKTGEKPGYDQGGRKGKIFSIFNIVQFKQDPCTASSDPTMTGSCMTTNECANAGGGKIDGGCAAGFGVCCTFTASCGTTTTVTRNSQYPASASASTSCSYTFNRIINNLCQIRLDFSNFVSAPPPTSGTNLGSCTTGTDFLILISPTAPAPTATTNTGSSPPIVCGTLTGQHMYLETGTTGTAGMAVFTFGTATSSTRTFKVKVTYYSCSSTSKAPAGCVQYFTAVSGSFQSYNFQGGTMLQNQNYQTCIRQAQGYCSIQYNQDDSTTPNSFNLYGSTTDTAGTTSNAINCPQTFVMIPTTLPAGTTSNKFCGAFLNPVDGQIVAGAVRGNISPFVLGTYSDATIGGGTSLTGYDIDYAQVPCSQ